MKKTIISHRVLTGLLIVFFGLGSIPDILEVSDAVVLFKHLTMPIYLLPFVGTAKLLGCIVLLFPRYARLKEWVYAGLTFDLTGAAFCSLSVGDPVVGLLPFLTGYALIVGSYVWYHRRLAGVAVRAGKEVRPALG